MARIEGEVVVARPVDEVFGYVADERHEPAYNPRMLRADLLTGEPVGLGSRFAAFMATRPRPMRMDTELTGFDPPRRLALRTTSGFGEVTGGITFDAVAGGTRMRWSWQLRPHGVLRLASPVLGWVGNRQEAAIWAGLKAHLESGSRESGDHAPGKP